MITGGPLNHPRNNTYNFGRTKKKAPDHSVAVAGYSSASQASANIKRDSVSECRSTKSQIISELGAVPFTDFKSKEQNLKIHVPLACFRATSTTLKLTKALLCESAVFPSKLDTFICDTALLCSGRPECKSLAVDQLETVT